MRKFWEKCLWNNRQEIEIIEIRRCRVEPCWQIASRGSIYRGIWFQSGTWRRYIGNIYLQTVIPRWFSRNPYRANQFICAKKYRIQDAPPTFEPIFMVTPVIMTHITQLWYIPNHISVSMFHSLKKGVENIRKTSQILFKYVLYSKIYHTQCTVFSAFLTCN